MINPLPMTKKEFTELLIRLSPANEFPLAQGTALPLLCLATASYCFVRQIENEDTAVLRYQIRCLEDAGGFDFTAWI